MSANFFVRPTHWWIVGKCLSVASLRLLSSLIDFSFEDKSRRILSRILEMLRRLADCKEDLFMISGEDRDLLLRAAWTASRTHRFDESTSNSREMDFLINTPCFMYSDESLEKFLAQLNEYGPIDDNKHFVASGVYAAIAFEMIELLPIFRGSQIINEYRKKDEPEILIMQHRLKELLLYVERLLNGLDLLRDSDFDCSTDTKDLMREKVTGLVENVQKQTFDQHHIQIRKNVDNDLACCLHVINDQLNDLRDL